MSKESIKEVIVVEGRDDTAAVLRALPCDTIETHGFGIRANTWALIDKAYNERGIIVFTDPDHAGLEIRRRILEKYPNAKEAHLARKDALKDNDIGIENARPEDILEALKKAKCTVVERKEEFTMEDMFKYGLTGDVSSKEKREELGKLLGIGYGNANAFLKKLNGYGISRKEFLEYESVLSKSNK